MYGDESVRLQPTTAADIGCIRIGVVKCARPSRNHRIAIRALDVQKLQQTRIEQNHTRVKQRHMRMHKGSNMADLKIINIGTGPLISLISMDIPM
jgi:hypothetical protein